MIKYENLFVCQTRFQLFSIMNIIKQYDISDYIILFINMYEGQERDIKTICGNGINNYVQINVGKGSRFIRLLKYIVQIIKYRKISVSKVFIGSFNGFTSLFLWMCCKRVQVFYFDEGYSSYSLKYYLDDPMGEIKDKHKILKLMGKNSFINSKTIYLHVPELCEKKSQEGGVNKINISDDVLDFFKDNSISSKYDSANYIFFDQYPLNKHEKEDRREILSFINNELGDRCLIKTHPRKDLINEMIKKDAYIISDDTNLWEAESKYIINPNKILVTVYSTAVFMPSLLFGLRYKIILLYKLVYSKESNKYMEIDNFVKRFKALRTDIEILLPESYGDLKAYINMST